MEKLYVSSQEQLRRGLDEGSVTLRPVNYDGCACCSGEPSAVILCGFHEGNALYFWEDEYKGIWGEEQNRGYRYGNDEVWLMASKEQVQRAMEGKAGEVSGTRSSML
ncbi:uncharacterized protein ACLA_097390 [Aspergillus clavatus NRRL 1]|uniref:Uncharacterized protein n=1 Tax=Aspergillus clavatus (strain ATCC 1007 / CBS 513.65 / DSM 816 / NCTC 3887 / NRRL 1 / QM 1276 / 107) TaxID=344612 RepID=A1CML4_ASPCL|nr:uncharacterized protein ACLA_097390 [Aspergillus clavatus NRRL 1]EAW08801.1 hypothetical protein ACLA_097390 [Aspergillus clavatus NRRL 1]